MLLERDPSHKGARDSGGTNLLHLVRNEELFKEIALYDTKLLGERDSKNQTVIEQCLSRNFSDELMQWIFETDPSLLSLPDNEGNLPIHTLFEGTRGEEVPRYTFIEWIVAKDPTLLEAPSRYGEKKSVHHAASRERYDLLKWAFKRYPKVFLMRDGHGCLPIHYCEWKTEQTDLFVSIFEVFSELLEEQDPYGMTPLHFACRAGNQKLVEWILERCDEKTETTPHTL